MTKHPDIKNHGHLSYRASVDNLEGIVFNLKYIIIMIRITRWNLTPINTINL